MPANSPPPSSGQAKTNQRSVGGKLLGGIVWTVLIAAGALLGLAAVSSITTRNVPIADEAPSSIQDEDIQSSSPVSVMPPSGALLDALVPLPLNDGKVVHSGTSISFQPIETRCGVERVLEWSKPGGQYCTITMSVAGRGRGDAVLKATEQAIYPLDESLAGYRGSFFLNSQGMPVREVLVGEAEDFRIVLVVDSPMGFVPATALLTETSSVQ